MEKTTAIARTVVSFLLGKDKDVVRKGASFILDFRLKVKSS